MMAKKALCVGINNYPGTDSDLSGCVNDANDWAATLDARGYEITLLLDDRATRKNIAKALEDLIGNAAAGDSRAFTFSGHGSWLPDENGDERDDRDEMLCPHDIGSNQYLLDDDLAEIFAMKPKGASLFFISDSCHSGSVAKFAPPLFPDAVASHSVPKFLPPETFLKGDALETARRSDFSRAASRQKYPALLFAGCRDKEYSYDAVFNGRPNGAFTRVALEMLKKNPNTPRAWMKEIRKHLPSNLHPQTPQLYGGRKAKIGPMF
jgi:hypothetical protein